MSLVARHCEAMAVPRLSDLLAAADIHLPVIGFLPFTHTADATALGALFDTSEQEISSRMHRRLGGEHHPDMVDYFGAPLERRHFDDRLRRVAVGALDENNFHRAAWALRALPVCPWSLEALTGQCGACGAHLGWTRTLGLNRCDRCGGNLECAQIEPLTEEMADELGVLRGLLSTEARERQKALDSLPTPFNEWDLNAVWDAVCELGALQVTHPRDSGKTNINLKGSLSFLGTEGIIQGLRFLRDFDERLSGYVSRCYAEIGSTSLRNGFGVLSRHLSENVRERPLTHLVRERLLPAVIDAKIPIRRQTKRHYSLADDRNLITMRQARELSRLGQRSLRRLEGQSSTFVSRSKERGGTALFNAVGIRNLKAALDSTLSEREVAACLGLPAYIVPAFVDAGLLAKSDNLDAALVSGGGHRITRASLETLIGTLQPPVPALAGGAVALNQCLPRRMDPLAWVTAVRHLIDGQLQQAKSDDRALARIPVAAAFLSQLQASVPHRRLTQSVSCQEGAMALGCTPQFISTAVAEGWVEGNTKFGRSDVSLQSLAQFLADYVATPEVAARRGLLLHQARKTMIRDGCPPVATINRVSLWRRCDVETLLTF